MTTVLSIHPDNPQQRLLDKASRILERGGVAVFPTESGYTLGCMQGSKEAIERIRQIRNLDKNHHFTLLCRDLSELSTYARVSNATFRLLKAHTPGPYTFILMATKSVPRRLQHPNRRTIGLRVTDATILRALLATIDEPLLSVSLFSASDSEEKVEDADWEAIMEKKVDLMITGGYCESLPSTVVDLTESSPKILRVGAGDPLPFEL